MSLQKTRIALAAALAFACADPPAEPPAPEVVSPPAKGEGPSGDKADRWNWNNDPQRFGSMNHTLAELPLSGRAERAAWPSTYWPTYEDSIQARWKRGERSPAEKYDEAFNGWSPGEDFDALRPFDRNRPVPEQDWDPAYYDQLGPLAKHVSSTMGNRRDRELAVEHDGRPEEGWREAGGTQTWWGLCHAWVPAAILEERPLRSVTYNGVTFHTGDLEALLIAAYNRTSADMIGGRCNDGSDEDSEVARDEHGRAENVSCRDTNPGSLFVIVTNLLGLQHRSFAEDRTYDFEVWNQPVVGYQISRLEEITVERAHELLGVTGDTYKYNEDAAKLYDVQMSTTYITESHASTTPGEASHYERQDHYTFILEVDAAGEVIGGEYYGSTRNNHPDFLWNPRRPSRSAVPHLDLDKVRMLIQRSREPEPTSGGDTVEVRSVGSAEIPDNDPAGASLSLSFPDSVVVGALEVEVDITHTYVGDLRVVIEHDGVERTLHERAGGSSDDIERSFPVIGFEGADAQGAWTLRVSDHAGIDVGRINGFVVRVTPAGEGGGEVEEPESYPGVGGLDIPDNDSAGIESQATIPEGTSGRVTVAVAVTHTYRGDLEVRLTSPHGQSWTLHDRTGGGADNLALDVTLDPQPSDLAGAWTLSVFDRAGYDTGTLDSWTLEVAP